MQLSPEALRLLDSFALRVKRSFYGMRQGAHRSQRRGHGVEFAEYRQYELGDNPRAIDWNLYGRSDKLYIKRYLEEENVAVYIVLDGSRSLTHSSLREKWDLAATIACSVGYVALATQDPVVVSVLGGPSSPRYWGAQAFGSLSTFLSEATELLVSDTAIDIDLVRAMKQAAARVRFPGLCVVISDFLYPQEQLHQMLAPLRARNMEIHAVQVLGTSDRVLSDSASGVVLRDSETGQSRGIEISRGNQERYAKLLSEHNARIRQHCLSARISFTEATPIAGTSRPECALATIRRMGLFV
jgi:uncharacterized protein (DUF58 family)